MKLKTSENASEEGFKKLEVIFVKKALKKWLRKRLTDFYFVNPPF